MQVIIPNAHQVNAVLRRLGSNAPPSDAELVQVLTVPPIATGLDHWALWTLVCLHRHLDRQRWVGFIVESRLKGDLSQIGREGAFGHPEALAQSGKVPDEPDWGYYFHGRGCCLTNEVTGVRIDVDFTEEGDSGRIDRFFYSDFLLSLSVAEFPERLVRRKEPFQHAWQAEIDRLGAAACVEARHGLRLTQNGFLIAEAIEPLVKHTAELLERGTATALRHAIYAALAVGDVVLASQLASQTDVDSDLRRRFAGGSEATIQSRLRRLQASLKDKAFYGPSHLAAIADVGPELAGDIVTSCLFRSPVDGTANTALEIERAWNRPSLVPTLAELLNRRHKEANGFGSILSLLGSGTTKRVDELPRNYQVTRACLTLFQSVRLDSLDTRFRRKVRWLLEAAGGAQAGEVALLIYILDRDSGLRCLRQALSGKVPAAHKEAAAACVIIGSREAEQILKAALSNPNTRIQHTAACALGFFPTEAARGLARQWFAQNDGINQPQGEEVNLFGRTVPVFSFEDISHANMDSFFKWSLEKLRKDFKSIL